MKKIFSLILVAAMVAGLVSVSALGTVSEAKSATKIDITITSSEFNVGEDYGAHFPGSAIITYDDSTTETISLFDGSNDDTIDASVFEDGTGEIVIWIKRDLGVVSKENITINGKSAADVCKDVLDNAEYDIYAISGISPASIGLGDQEDTTETTTTPEPEAAPAPETESAPATNSTVVKSPKTGDMNVELLALLALISLLGAVYSFKKAN